MADSFVAETRQVAKRFGDIWALRGVDLRVHSGETYGLLGPNGSGKTTLIRLLTGLLVPTSGEVFVLGQRMPNKSVLSQIGYMTQSVALYQELTVKENLQFFGAVYGLPNAGRIEDVLRLVELEERADSQVFTLSGGMRQRVSLACALLHQPRLLLLDEPTVGIDPQLRAGFWRHFRELNGQGITIILSSHVMDEAERCDRLGMLREGVLLAEGTPEELRQKAGTRNLEDAFIRFTEGGEP